MMQNDENAEQVRSMDCIKKRWGGWGGGQPPLFANKMMYITPASLDGLTQKKGGGSTEMI